MLKSFATFLHALLLSLYGIHAPAVVTPVPDYSQDISHLESRISTLEQSQADTEHIQLGASQTLPLSIALFSTSLQSAIGSGDTTMTLVAATYNNGVSTLASSTYDFILDEGTASQEFVSADCTATACTNMQRGLDFLTGTSTVASLQFSHRRGASVKITDAPILLKLNALAKGAMGYPGQIGYVTGFASTSITQATSFTDKDYVDSTAFNGAGIIDATNSARGVSILATGLQAASTTATLSAHPLVLPSSIATSSCASATTAALKVLVTANDGKLASNCINTTGLIPGFTATGANSNATSTFATSSIYIGAFPAYNIGKNIKAFTSTGTSTYAIPSGISKVFVRVIAAGGGSGGSGTCGNPGSDSSGGGGGGGYSEGFIDVSATTSVQVEVGAAGAAGGATTGSGVNGGRSTFGSNGFYINAGGGFGSALGTTDSNGAGGGTATGGDINITGSTGGRGTPGSNNTAFFIYGSGGLASFGAGSYGNGGQGGTCQNAGAQTGQPGAQGAVFVTW